jgi:hypothetical protein
VAWVVAGWRRLRGEAVPGRVAWAVAGWRRLRAEVETWRAYLCKNFVCLGGVFVTGSTVSPLEYSAKAKPTSADLSSFASPSLD